MENWHLGSLKCVPPLSRYNFRLPSSNLTDGFDHGSKAQFPVFFNPCNLGYFFKFLCYWEKLAKFYTKNTNQPKNISPFEAQQHTGPDKSLAPLWQMAGKSVACTPLGLNQGPFVVPGSQTGLCRWPITWGKISQSFSPRKGKAKHCSSCHTPLPPPQNLTPPKRKKKLKCCRTSSTLTHVYPIIHWLNLKFSFRQIKNSWRFNIFLHNFFHLIFFWRISTFL
jgi:hypothetical protein